MMRFHTALSTALAAAILLPPFLGQAPIATLKDALGGTTRALEVLNGLEQRLQEDPAAALGLILSATEAPAGTVEEREQRLEGLRNEVNLLQMQLDALESPVTTADGEIAHFLGTVDPLATPRPALPVAITTGLDESLRRALAQPSTTLPRAPSERTGGATGTDLPGRGQEHENAYTADPLRHGITCYRAGRYGEAYELLLPLDGADALYWRSRVLERLNRMDEAIDTMERAILGAGEGFDLRRAQTDLEFLRWKRTFLQSLPEDARARVGQTPEVPR